MGQVVRLVILSIMAGYAYWKIGPAAAGALALEAAVIGALAVWGLVGLASVFSMALLVAFGQKPEGALMVLAAPIFLQEMVMAVWLIARGFSPGAAASESDRRPLAA